MESVTNKYVVTKNHIDGAPNESDFSICEELISLKLNPAQISDNDAVIVKVLYVSIDPYQINRMKTQSSSQKTIPAAAALLPGQAIPANGVGKVVSSAHPGFRAVDLVSGPLNWGEYAVVKGGHLLQILDNSMGFPLSYYAGGVLDRRAFPTHLVLCTKLEYGGRKYSVSTLLPRELLHTCMRYKPSITTGIYLDSSGPSMITLLEFYVPLALF